MVSSMTFQPTTLLLAMSFYILGANYVPPCASPQYVKFGGVGVLHCTFSDEFFGIFWYDTTDYINSFSIVNLKGSSKSGSGFLSGEFDVHLNGSLIIANVSLQHDRQFTVLKFNSPSDDPKPCYIQVIVVVNPVPAFPVVDGCNQEEICELNLESEGKLNCSVLGVRPRVSLGWRTANERSSAYITFGEEQTNIINHGNTFDVFLTSNYRIIDFSLKRIILECVVTGVNKELFQLKTEVSIAFTSCKCNICGSGVRFLIC
ncbi:hypothetical protein HOLleu_02776 [Holothuria leucospilota]|uniref:Ig-like domain-containing protein n=1 Tax=Holothuria leucospilota TaxID=206669 RepID=A0A9Q1CS36_HOLLE|nr:hypothetical protein HOLleu_02776 [Holothuria leucospilota]